MLEERRITEEIMDDPSLSSEDYGSILHDLARVNRLTLAYRPTLSFLARAHRREKRLKILDVGYGSGDMLRVISRWGQRRGMAMELVGIDLNPNSLPHARLATPPGLPITFLSGDYANLASEKFDCIISSLVAHHMSHEQLVRFIAFMEREAQLGWFINDLHRHAFAYLGFPLLARAMRWHPVVRADGQTSIARSYRPAEWPPILAEAGIAHAVIRRSFPFRLCVERIR